MKQHISYSELKMWADCPRKHKLVYIDKLKGFTGNEYTAFGSSIHALCENAIQDQIEESDYDEWNQDDVCITGSTKEDKT